MIRSARLDVRPYLCCGSSKLIAKHSRVVRVVVGKANCGYAERLEVGREALRSPVCGQESQEQNRVEGEALWC